MNFKIVSLGLSLLLLHIFCYNGASAISKENEKRIKLGIDAVQNIAGVLSQMKFLPWVSGIGTAVGLILTVVSVFVDIGFDLQGDPSPELLELQKGFAKMNNRLDAFSVQFQEVKKQIDWSEIQLEYARLEATIDVFTDERMRIMNMKNETKRKEAIQSFLFKFENGYGLTTERLWNAMSKGTVLSTNIFDAARKYTDQHPEQSFHFMKGCTQLLAQSFAIQATYIKLRYNNTLADEYFRSLVIFKMKAVQNKAKSVYDAMQDDWYNQMKKDVKRLASMNQASSHTKFADLFYNYISGKYVLRDWFVNVYDPIWTWEKHGSYITGGNHFFRLTGRNINVASFYRNESRAFDLKWANNLLDSIHVFRQDRDGAKGLLNRILSKITEADPVAAVVAVIAGSHMVYRADKSRAVSKVMGVKWCNTNLCWIKKIRNYDVVLFG